jgi:hypothetical protein
MPLTNTLFHPKMMETLQARFFPSLCAVYATDNAANAIGETVRTPQASPVVGLERVYCNLSQVLGRGADFSEERDVSSTYVSQQYECQLCGYFTGIVEDMVAVVDGVSYDIRGVKQPSVSSHTVLLLERVR